MNDNNALVQLNPKSQVKVLIIGGTRFVGRAISNILLKNGHQLTLFHRGKTNPDFLPQVEHIIGDRETDLDKLSGNWDVVIDTCGYFPRVVKLSAEHLKDKADYYMFISTLSVYAPSTEMGMDENAILQQLQDPTTEDMQSEENAYGGLKVLCEEAVTNVFGTKVIIVRPGLIVGPFDPTNRFTYWLVRLRKAGSILAPGNGTMPTQYIDVRDLAEFVIQLVEECKSGIFNATGPKEPLTLLELFNKVTHTLKVEPSLQWIDDDWLLENEVIPWSEMPLWIPSDEGRALMSINTKVGQQYGLSFRALHNTILDTLDWYDSINGDNKEWTAGMTEEREKELLSKYQGTK